MENDTQIQIDTLRRELQALTAKVNLNNFSASQDFNKSSSFSTSLKVPVYTVNPSVCQVGEIISVAGVLRICSTVNTWTNV